MNITKYCMCKQIVFRGTRTQNTFHFFPFVKNNFVFIFKMKYHNSLFLPQLELLTYNRTYCDDMFALIDILSNLKVFFLRDKIIKKNNNNVINSLV